jgi:predicted nucleic acid-binding protein
MAQPELDQGISRLAQYRPFAQGGRVVQAALRDLASAAAAEAGGGFENLAECRDGIQTLFGLEIEIHELRGVVAQLVDGGEACPRGTGFDLSHEQHEALEAQAAVSREMEEKAFRDWEIASRAVDPTLTDAEFELLRADLDSWLQRVISRHGVEAALILYPENPRARSLYEAVESEGLDFLPARSGRLRRVREQAIQQFVQQPTGEQRAYLSNLLNVSYFLTVLSLDPSASQLVQQHVRGHRVYLDTNVLYAALALSKMTDVLSVRRVLELTKQIGFELAITPWTLSELKESLRRAEQAVKSRALPPREWADTMADATSQQGFITAYWRQYKARGVTPEDFFAFYSALERILSDDGIAVVEQGCKRIEDDADAVDREIPRLDSVLRRNDDRRPADPRPDVVMRHDIKHRLLIERLRGDGDKTFATARYWFLTRDSALPRYAAIRDSGDGGVPFCASTSAWAQVVRSLVPRTDDLDQALVDLLASPYMRYRGGISPQDIQEVVARIDQYEGVSPELASEVLLNGAMVREISKTIDPEERREKIDLAVVKTAEALHIRVEALSARDVEQREALRLAAAEKASQEAEIRSALDRIAELEGSLEAVAQERAAADRAVAAKQLVDAEERTSLAARMSAAEQRMSEDAAARERRRTVARWLLAAVLWIAGIALPTALLATRVLTAAWPVVGILLGGLLVVCLGLWLVIGWRRTWRTFVAGAVVVGVIAAIQELVTAL